jgi:hypothetical protein
MAASGGAGIIRYRACGVKRALTPVENAARASASLSPATSGHPAAQRVDLASESDPEDCRDPTVNALGGIYTAPVDAADLDARLWRVRRRGDWIDASLQSMGAVWRLELTRKGRRLASWELETREDAVRAGRMRLREFERAGWIEHW